MQMSVYFMGDFVYSKYHDETLEQSYFIILTFGVILGGHAKPLWGARDTAVNLMNLERGLSFLLQALTILPDIFIWHQNRYSSKNITDTHIYSKTIRWIKSDTHRRFTWSLLY